MKIKKVIKNIITMYYVKEMIFVSPCRKILIKLSVYISFVLIAILTCLVPHFILKGQELFLQDRFSTDLKYILLWKPMTDKINNVNFYNKESKLPQGQKSFIKQKCKHINCYITYDKHLLKEDHRNLDAVVFNVRDVINFMSGDIDLIRSPNQKYIFYSLESSQRYPICNPFFDNFFNWTWTYKLNSDISQPFFNIYDVNNELIGPKRFVNWTVKMIHNERFSNKFPNKSKAVAWLVTKCKLKVKYQDFIRDLKMELKGYNYTFDIYGSCGDETCPGKRVLNCYRMIEKNYFFQLILEDSLAEDYVTERTAKAMTYTTIPILIGISNYHSFLPPGSYINAQTFDIKKLGAIIDYLIRYRSTYEYFFDWKNYYYYTMRPRIDVCGLCSKLNEKNSSSNVYNNFRMWWNQGYVDACRKWKFNNMFFKTTLTEKH